MLRHVAEVRVLKGHMKRARKILIVLAVLGVLLAVFGGPPAEWKQVHASMTWQEASAKINQKGRETELREFASADGQRHTAITMFFYSEFLIFPVWVLRVDFLDDRVQQVKRGLNIGE